MEKVALAPKKQALLVNRLKALIPLVGIVICAIGVGLIFHLLREHSIRDVIAYLASIPSHLKWSALALTGFSYLLLTGYDLLAFRFIGRELSRAKIIFVALIAFAFGNNIGMANLAGSSVRFRLYSAFGLAAGDILKIVLFSSLTFWLGVATLGGFLLATEPLALPASLGVSQAAVRGLGFALLAVAAGYLALCTFQREPFSIRGRKLHLPSVSLGFEQILVAAGDWVLAALVLFLLMPASTDASFGFFLTVFVSAQVLALIAHVPGGIGLLESLMIYFVSPDLEGRTAVLGALIAYRVVYYFLPLAFAITGLIGFEIYRKRHDVGERRNTWKAT